MSCDKEGVSLYIDDTVENPTDDTSAGFDYTYKHRSTNINSNDRERFIWEVLRLSLEATREEFGDYQIIPVEDINQVREDQVLYNDTGVVNIISDTIRQEHIDKITPINIPILRHLLGYRVFLIKEDNALKMSSIADIEDLREFSFGVGPGWGDKIILEASGIEVFVANDYESLFRHLSSGHFDIFSRGVNEILGEYDNKIKEYPDMFIDDNVLLYYPLTRYFWFADSFEGDKLRERVSWGIDEIIKDGSFYKLFDEYFKDDLEKLKLDERVIIRIENPLYTEEYRLNDEDYIYDPFK